MVSNEKIITINRPIDEVFAYNSDLRNSPKWQKGLAEARRITEGPPGVGTQYSDVRKFIGGKLESIIQCTSYEPNKKIIYKTISGSWPFEDTYLFESTAEGTRLTNRLELQTSGWMSLTKPLIASGLKREMDAAFGELKNLLESRIPAVVA